MPLGTGVSAAAGTPGSPLGAASSGSPFPRTGATALAATDDEDDDEHPARRRHPYTWLHIIVLALVAFVLGFLVMALWNQGKSNGADGTSGAVGAVVVPAPDSSSAA